MDTKDIYNCFNLFCTRIMKYRARQIRVYASLKKILIPVVVFKRLNDKWLINLRILKLKLR